MPELPEVETIARTLEPMINGRKCLNYIVYNQHSVQGDIPLDVLIGAIFGKPFRRGKLLLIPLVIKDRHVYTVCIHLKMTGRIVVYPQDRCPTTHTRVTFSLDNGNTIFFEDIRKFGYVRILSTTEEQVWPFWNTLGPEPLEIDVSTFIERFQGRRGNIKSLLLNQKVIAGCGNIYADESLFRAQISPMATVSQLSMESITKLYHALQEVLLEAIAGCGSSIKDYRAADGNVGAFQNSLNVYGRFGKPCVVCKKDLKGTRIGGRMTVWCSSCQSINGSHK